MAVRILVDLDKAKEVTVNTSLAAWENIKFVRPDTPFDIWMKGIALFNIFTIIREQASKSESSSENLKPITPNTAIHSKNKLELLIMSLPDKERLIFILYSIEGYTYQEVSDFLPEFSVGEIKFVVRETRKKLIEALKDEL
ncbi:MAG: hypothetical protein KKG93_10690 [Bacteroidetes bacterium]|nr:hypothetical protein [Bacteroidota bacterium]